MTRRLILMVAALAAVAWLYFALRDAASVAGRDALAPLRISAHVPPVEALRERSAAEDGAAKLLAASPERAELYEAWHALMEAQAGAATGKLAAVAPETEQRLERAVSTWVGRFGPDTFAAAGVQPWTAFEAALAALRERSRANGRGLVAQLAADRPELQAEVNRACGEFLALTTSMGLMDAAGQLPMSDELLRLVFRYRWLSQARAARPLQALMTPVELDTFWRWRIEQGRSLPPESVARFVADVVEQRGGYAGVKGGYALPAVFLLRGEPAFAYDALVLEQKAHPAPDTERLIAAVAALAKAPRGE